MWLIDVENHQDYLRQTRLSSAKLLLNKMYESAMHKYLSLFVVVGLVLTLETEPLAQDAGSQRFHVRVGAPAGIRRYTRDTWGMIAVQASNRTDEPAELVASAYFSSDPNLQYARKLWVPPRSSRYSWCPIRVPADIPLKDERTTIRTLVTDGLAEDAQLIKSSSGQMLGTSLLPMSKSSGVTGILLNPEGNNEMAYEAIFAMRISLEMTRTVIDMTSEFQPPIPEALEGLHQLVIASDVIADDIAGQHAIRNWIERGGIAWIMLNRVDPEIVTQLLGDTLDLEIVDQIGLTEITIEDGAPENDTSEKGDRDYPTRSYDEPLSFLRVLADDVDVLHRVHGWPASFSKQIGKGRVLVTTLDPQAFIQKRPSKPGRDPLYDAAYIPWPFAESLAEQLFPLPQPPTLSPQEFAPFLSEQIGYQIVQRSTVLFMLSFFCLGLTGVGVWCFKVNKSERLAVVGPVIALVTAVFLIGIGFTSRHVVLPTVAAAQLIEVASESDQASLSGLVTLYDAEMISKPIAAGRGGVVVPQLEDLGGSTRRMIWTGLDEWYWEDLALPAGTHSLPFKLSTQIDSPIGATAQFGQEGLEGTLQHGPLEGLSDAIVATPLSSGIGARLNGDGSFTCTPNDVLAPGQFIAGAFMDDEQRRRQTIYQKLFVRRDEFAFPARPTLLTWADPLETHFRFSDRMQSVGSALVAIPLEIQRTPPGHRVRIPSSFMPFKLVVGPGGVRSSSIYSSLSGDWSLSRRAGQAWFRFRVPEQVLPLAIEEAIFGIQINAPSWQLEVSHVRGDVSKVIDTRSNPIGLLRIPITGSEEIKSDEHGNVTIGIKISSSDSDDKPLEWKVDTVWLQLEGTTFASSAELAPPSEINEN